MHHSNEANKIYLGPPEVEVKQSQAKFSQHCSFGFQLELNFLDFFNVKACDLCCQSYGHSIYSPWCKTIWHCILLQ